MATKAEIDAQNKADEEELARLQAEEDAANADDTDDAQPAGGVQKYRVLTGAAVLTATGKNRGTRYDHGAILELNSDDENTQRLVDLRAIELASEPYKGRATGRLISEAANKLAQTNQPTFVPGSVGTPLPANEQAAVVLDPNHPEDADQ